MDEQQIRNIIRLLERYTGKFFGIKVSVICDIYAKTLGRLFPTETQMGSGNVVPLHSTQAYRGVKVAPSILNLDTRRVISFTPQVKSPL